MSLFQTERELLCSVKIEVPSQSHNITYYPIHLAVIFNRTEILDTVYHHMEDKCFASKVISLKVGDTDNLQGSSSMDAKEKSL